MMTYLFLSIFCFVLIIAGRFLPNITIRHILSNFMSIVCVNPKGYYYSSYFILKSKHLFCKSLSKVKFNSFQPGLNPYNYIFNRINFQVNIN